jgi:argininosuccinate lyase
MMAKLWQKDYELNELIESFTVGDDYLLDRELAAADCFGSAAHASMLKKIGIITETELSQVLEGLKVVLEQIQEGLSHGNRAVSHLPARRCRQEDPHRQKPK